MIKSVTFPETGEGYIYKILPKPEKPEKPSEYEKSHHRTEEDYLEEMNEYKKKMAYYRKHKGEYVLKCSYNLVGKTFNFEDKKINVIFGQNGSGKTTIIKSIAGEFMCQDGFTCFKEPYEFGISKERSIGEVIGKMKQNTSVVDFDGIPVYYDNFEYRMAHSTSIGDLVGSFLDNLGDEISYVMSSGRMSSGQNSVYILNRIIQVAGKEVSMKDVAQRNVDKFTRCNDTWQKTGVMQYDYFSKMNSFEEKHHPVLLFDEIDKSLDIETVWRLYTQFLPKVIEKFENQIIMVSHNPLILTEKIFNNNLYNIVSVDPEYTNNMKNMLKEVKF